MAKSIKVSDKAHQRLKVAAAKNQEHVYQLVDKLTELLWMVNKRATNGSKARK